MKKTILIDVEFSGLDNSYVHDNEIVQLKLMDADTGTGTCIDFKAKKPVSLYHRAYSKLDKEYPGETLFSAGEFAKALQEIGIKSDDERQYFGYSVSTDVAMLKKYGVQIKIVDLQERIRLNPNYERELAVGCSSMEAAYLLLTGKKPPLDTHLELGELDLVREIYQHVMSFNNCKQLLMLMPHGHCAGMPIPEYVTTYRRQADGYRYNNVDLLSRSLTNAIPAPASYDDDSEDEDFEDEDDVEEDVEDFEDDVDVEEDVEDFEDDVDVEGA